MSPAPRRRRRRTATDRAVSTAPSLTCAKLLIRFVLEHGAQTDVDLCAGMHRQHGTKWATTRGRRAELVRAGELERVGTSPDGWPLYDIRGIVRTPKPAPPEQRTLFG